MYVFVSLFCLYHSPHFSRLTQEGLSHLFPFVGWRPGRANTAVWRLESRKVNGGGFSLGLKSWEPGMFQSEDRCPSSAVRQRVNYSFLLLLVYLCSQWIGWYHPQWGGPSALLSPPIKLLISSENTLTGTPRNNVLAVIWHYLSKLSGTKLTITLCKHILTSDLFPEYKNRSKDE